MTDPYTEGGVCVFHDGGEFYACEMVGAMPVPLEGPFPTLEWACDASRRIGVRKELSPAGMAALAAMIRLGVWKFEEAVRAPKKRRKW